MCGIFGDVARRGLTPTIGREAVDRLRDRMADRGPDGAATWTYENVCLAHRRLAVRAPGPDGDQPLRSADGRWAIVYNGELYEDEELRAALAAQGRPPHRAGDAATVLAAFEAWGPAAIARLRGMFAIAAVDLFRHRLVLARDPFGMKPLYWWADAEEVVFASAPRAVLEHPRVPILPDVGMVSAYLSTLRTELEDRTLFEGLRVVEPGQLLEFDLEGKLSAPRARSIDVPPVAYERGLGLEDAARRLRATLADSVERHLVADVPVASLLSGGLDSTCIAALLRDRVDVPTYCSGTRGEVPGDLEHARAAADALGLRHRQVEVGRDDFERGWTELIDTTGLPLSTPNEVAILAVCRALRADGNVVALSGEGADELLAGYEGVMRAARRFETGGAGPLDGGRFHLEIGAWVGPAAKAELLAPEVWDATENDAFTIGAYRRSFERALRDTPPEADPLDAHLRFLRRTNLAGLLLRLDKAAMTAGVEARAPFADREVAGLAESLPFHTKFDELLPSGVPSGKIVLRRALETEIPPAIAQRQKASFPLPFQGWLGEAGRAALEVPFARALFQPRLLELVAREPEEHWSYAWPMLNLARWGARWWS